jgi:hypothetical protein
MSDEGATDEAGGGATSVDGWGATQTTWATLGFSPAPKTLSPRVTTLTASAEAEKTIGTTFVSQYSFQ